VLNSWDTVGIKVNKIKLDLIRIREREGHSNRGNSTYKAPEVGESTVYSILEE
jgi:hypothetical protein